MGRFTKSVTSPGLGGKGFFGNLPVAGVTRTWTTIVTGFEATGVFTSIATNHTGTWVISVAVSGAQPNVLVSTDNGITWATHTLPVGASPFGPRGIAFGAGLFVLCLSLAANVPQIWTSPDGITWTQRVSPFTRASGDLRVTFGDGGVNLFFAFDAGGTQYATSPDGITWTLHAVFVPTSWSFVEVPLFDGTRFVTGVEAGGLHQLAFSPDGINFSLSGGLALPAQVSGLGFDGSNYSVGNITNDVGVWGPTLLAITTVISFNDSGLPTQQILFGGTTWARLDDNGTNPAAVSSTNGKTWQPDTTATGGSSVQWMDFGMGKFIAVGNGPNYVMTRPGSP